MSKLEKNKKQKAKGKKIEENKVTSPKEKNEKKEKNEVSKKSSKIVKPEPSEKKVEAEKIEKRNDTKKEKKSPLRTFLKTLLIFMIVLFSSLYYMRFIETKLLFVKEVKIESPLIPESLSGLKVVQFSDLHYGVTTDEKDLARLVKKIQLVKPDILVFTGDLLDDGQTYQEEDYQAITTALSKMDVPISKYYVKGNHDYSNGMIEAIFDTAGFTSLNNKSDIVYGSRNETIQIVGLGSFLKNDFQQEAAFENVQDGIYTIAIFHEPDNMMELESRNIQLALAGHSHNNQNGIPYLKDLFTKEGARTFYNNHYQVNGTELYVNSGIGTGHNKLRMLAPPMINLYRLVKS